MKKLFAVCMAALLALSLISCGKSEAKKVRIGVSIPAADHGWTGGVVWSAEEAKKRLEAADPELEIIISTARDAAEQVSKIENLMVRNVDALVVLPQEPGPLTGVCEEAKKQGIFLVTVDRGLEKPVQDVNVAGDNAGFGRAAAQAIVAALDGKGDILVMEGIPCVVNTDRVEAFRQELAGHPDLKIMESQSAYWDTEKGLKLMENYLQKYPKIDAVWVGDDDVLLGALKALQESGRRDVRLMLGGGGSRQVIKMILDADPVVNLTVTYPPRMIEVGITAALEGVRNEGRVPAGKEQIVMPSEIVNRDNAADFYFPDSIY
ncbi:substrate-binding domain-containing protein [Victivallis sp. Marseille-Q1083]|uniref:substrate-binding domain-containing protein n=1 Tax=Victivallis sp. Marseille-Q1083 TaxID=2717288 RepID=UPI00158AAC14|nr:substrate-binding domain-containing protein [Victivallis sp. Marseille-Q1083]